MKKVFAIRHQAAGILTEYMFSEEPTQAQLAAVGEICAQRHGTKHAKTGETLWLKVMEMQLLEPSDTIEVSRLEASTESSAKVESPSLSAVGTVKNR
jgi:hypothetical protein